MKRRNWREVVELSWGKGVGLACLSGVPGILEMAEAGLVVGVEGERRRSRVEVALGCAPSLVRGRRVMTVGQAERERRMDEIGASGLSRMNPLGESGAVRGVSKLISRERGSPWAQSLRLKRGDSALKPLVSKAVHGRGFPEKHAEKGRLKAMREEALDAWGFH